MKQFLAEIFFSLFFYIPNENFGIDAFIYIDMSVASCQTSGRYDLYLWQLILTRWSISELLTEIVNRGIEDFSVDGGISKTALQVRA